MVGLPDSWFFDMIENKGGRLGRRRLENVSTPHLATCRVFLHVRKLSSELEIILYLPHGHKKGGLDNNNIRGWQVWGYKRYKAKRRNERKYRNG